MLTGLVFEGHFPKKFTQALEKLPASVETVFRTAVAESPANRYGSAGQMASELEAALKQVSEQGLPPPVGFVEGQVEETITVDMTPPPPPMETDPGSGMSAPPLGMKQPPREEPTEKISHLGETTLQEEREQPVISKKVAEQFPELVMDDEEVPFSKQIDDEAVDPAFGDPTGDYVFEKEDLAHLVPMAETDEGAPVTAPPLVTTNGVT